MDGWIPYRVVIVVGDSSCGKTRLIHRALSRYPGLTPNWQNESVPCVAPPVTEKVVVNGKTVNLVLVDSAGSRDYDELRSLTYKDADALLICYSIGSPASLASVLDRWHPEVASHCPDVPILLGGCKKDLRDDVGVVAARTTTTTTDVEEEPVTSKASRLMAERIGAIGYVECSARDGDGVGELLELVAWAALESKRNRQTKRKRCIIQ